jgi:hypothetical protein
MDLCDVSDDVDLRIKPAQHFSRDHSGGHAPDRFARGSASAALPIPDSVFCFVGEVGVRRPEFLCDLRIILRSRIFIANENSNRRAERFAFKHSGKNFATIFLLPLRRDFALTRAPTVELALNVGLGDVNLRRTAIDHDADAAAVRLAERRHPKELAVSISHRAANLDAATRARYRF